MGTLRADIHALKEAHALAGPAHPPRYAFQSWPEIAARVRNAKSRALLLDFDGTLVRLRQHPQDVRLPGRTRKILERLASRPGSLVAIVSGRTIRDLKRKLKLNCLRFFGLHGAEREAGSFVIPPRTRRILSRVRRETQTQLHRLPGIWIEEKSNTFVVHYRGAQPAVAQAAELGLWRILAPHRFALRVLKGDKVWEVLPKDMHGKGACVERILKSLPEGTPAIYIGDDETDETAFQALRDHITVKVGRSHSTHAHFYVRNPAEVLRFLTRLEKEIA